MKMIDQIFCDDIRFEQLNKLSLMGVYGDRIVFKVPPGTAAATTGQLPPINLSFFLRFELDRDGLQPDPPPDGFKFRYILNKKEFPLVEGPIKVDPMQTIFSITIKAASLLLEPGVLGFDLKIFSRGREVFSESKRNALKIVKE